VRITPFASSLVALAAAVSLAGCAANEAAPAGSAAATSSGATLTGKGSSAMKAAQEKWVADFQTANSGVTVNYSPEGSGAGRSAFIAGAAQFAGSDRALKDEEMGAGKFAGCAADSSALNLPVYVSPIAIIFNIEGVDSLTLDPATAAGIFAGKITTWNDPAIAKTNPGVTLPDGNITAVHRADDSGTTSNFTDTLNALAPTVWTEAASDAWPAAIGGEAATGTSGVVGAVTNGTNTIGYADASQAAKLGHVTLLVDGKKLTPTADAASKIVDASPLVKGRATNDLALKLDRTSEGAYPAVLVSYVIVCETYQDSATAKLVKDYVGYIASSAGQQSAATAAGSAPLSSAFQAKVKAAVDSIK